MNRNLSLCIPSVTQAFEINTVNIPLGNLIRWNDFIMIKFLNFRFFKLNQKQVFLGKGILFLKALSLTLCKRRNSQGIRYALHRKCNKS